MWINCVFSLCLFCLEVVSMESIGDSMYAAAVSDNLKKLTLLVENIELDPKQNLSELINVVASEGRTPLHGAAIVGNIDMLRYLLEKGANTIAVRDKSDNQTPVECAIANGHLSSAKLLIDYALANGVALSKVLSLDGMDSYLEWYREKWPDSRAVRKGVACWKSIKDEYVFSDNTKE